MVLWDVARTVPNTGLYSLLASEWKTQLNLLKWEIMMMHANTQVFIP